MKLTQDQIELLEVIKCVKSKLKINAMINETLGEDRIALKDIVNLNNLYAIFVNSFEDN